MHCSVIILLVSSLFKVSHLKFVTSVLNANWKSTPIIIETSEFLAEEDNALFFKFIEKFGGTQFASEQAEYDAAISAASTMLPAVSVSLLKLALSLRQYSPRAVMFNKVAESVRGSLDCQVFLDVNSKTHCMVSDIGSLLEKQMEYSSDLIKYDHIYRSNKGVPQVILYCDIRTKDCIAAHKSLSLLADDNQISYIFRHYFVPGDGQVQLSGYGVELAIKSTEYTVVDDSTVSEGEKADILKTREEEEVEGFRFAVLKEKYPNKVDELNSFKDSLIDNKDDLKPLKAWEISDLGFQASQKVFSASADESLEVLSRYSQNLPSLARSLSRTKVSSELRKEIKMNQDVLQRYNVNPGSSVLLLNGMLIDLESADPLSLLKKLRSEATTVGGLSSLGIPFADINKLLKSDLYKQTAKYGIDMRDDAVLYVNDLENGESYKFWPSDIQELLRPSYPGMLKHIRKNINNLVIVLRPSDPNAVTLMELFSSLVQNDAPVRIGFVFTSVSEEVNLNDIDVVLPAMVSHIFNTEGRESVQEFLTEVVADGFKIENARSEFSDMVGTKVEEAFVSENNALLIAGNQFLKASGVSSSSIIINGVVLDDIATLEEKLLETIQSQTPKLQRAVYLGEVNDKTNILDWFMDDNNILPRHSPQIMKVDSLTIPLTDLDKSGPYQKDLDGILRDNTWFGSDSAAVSMVTVGDYSSETGRQLLAAALEATQKLQSSRVSLMFTHDTDLNFALWTTLESVESELVVVRLLEILENGGGQGEHREAFKDIVRKHAGVAHAVLQLPDDAVAILCNGRVIGPLRNVLSQDIELIELLELRSGAGKLGEILVSQSSDTVMRASSVLRKQEAAKRISFPELETSHSCAVLPGEGPFEVEAVLDPLSLGAQQISQILHVLYTANLITLRIILNPVERLSEMPVKRFYRYVLEPELSFTEAGSIAELGSRFTNLSPHVLLTMSLSTPINWMVASTRSPYDLDNIRLNDVDQGVHADYALEYLVIEGHSHDSAQYNSPTKGLQYDLKSGNVSHDTIVMSNLGYFQLKAGPGIWTLSLRDGPSKDIYSINGVEGPGDLRDSGEVIVTVGDLTSTFITVDATKKSGMSQRSISEENEIQNPVEGKDSGIWDSIKSFVGSNGKSGGSTTNDTINIFSVASGHLYERMLGIMMQSVLAHTKNPVKFWFLKNYLSPKFINSIPTIAKELGCEVEFVQYQWPSWLHAQTEKQRIIWGYKILFLDVLFPMNLKKIIFVDADQIVRADMKELVDLDMKGAPYGYTPFCDDRPEMDGFRFWKQGYWRNHLMGRAYHISALYVVDLQKFRLISAGDRLRGQYQGLSQDPNSLANLDQDLPNNMIHHVPIFSLPQEWLWCETWCSDASKANAKTIDLCNNPETKEPKLDRAMRIIPEWKEYDAKLKKILEQVDSNKGSSLPPSPTKDPKPHSEL